MKKLNFTFLFTMLMSMVGLNASAKDHDIEVQNADGKTIYYNFIIHNNNTELAVTYRGYVYNDYSNEYTGNVVIPESVTYNNGTYRVTSIGYGAFDGCSGLTSVTIPNSVTSIGNNAFYGCKGLTSVTIPNSVTSIGNGAFQGCSSLYSVTIPNSVTSIGGYAFDGTAWYGNQLDGLVYAGKVAYKYKGTMPENTSITIKDGTCSITGSAFSGCSGLTSIEIPNSVTSIGKSAFSGCSKLTSITIPNSVTSIGGSAFEGCSSLYSVTIPNSVTSIGDYAFSNCFELTLVECNIGKAFYISSNTFSSDTYNNAELRVPRGLSSMYKQAIGWKNFKSITEGDLRICGDNLTYTYSEASGKLTIQGTGAMYNYSSSSPAPWNSYKGDIITIVIEDGATSVGSYAFSDCNSLYSVTFGKDVKTVGSRAFWDCQSLKEVIAPDIAAWCGINFGNETANPLYYVHHLYSDKSTEITELVIPDGVTSIGSYAFSGWSVLPSVTIPNSVTSIGSSAFSGCSGLTSVTIGTGVTSIGSDAFSGCSGLTSVTINSDAILSKTYTSSSNLSNIFGGQVKQYIIGNSVTSIGGYAFYGCSGLASVTIGSGVTSIGSSAFYGCSGLQKVIAPDIAAWCGINFGNETANPLNYAHHLYSDDNTEITELVIPDGVTSIGATAFSGCSELTSVTIGSGVTSIGRDAFSGCSGLTSVTINSDAILSKTYTSSSNLSNIFGGQVKQYIIGNSVTSIGEDAFYNCYGLTSITIPNSVTYIGGLAFNGCSGLTSVTIPNSVTSIGNSAFYGCSGLTSITIPNSVTTIGKGAFANCSAITSIKVQEENTKYDSREDCNAIIETASNTLIVGCKSSVIPNNVTSIGESAFENCAGLTSIIIPNSVTSIEKDAFEDCRDLTSLSLGENVKSIGVRAFNQCTALTSISIPNSVTSIETDAFDDCTALTSIYSYIENPTNNTGSNFDSSNYSNATLYVPQGTKDKYLATDGWKNFTNIVEMNETEVKEISASEIKEVKSFSIEGKQLSQPQKGLNILKMSDGTTRKIVSK